MALDLSALEDQPILAGTAEPDGKAMRAKVADVMPDPNQPRTIKDPDEIAEMGANIRERGVKQPISVKPHPDKPGKWIINDGELRWLSSQWAQVDDIPIVVDEDFDDFDQVNANEKRFNLRPIELAQFVRRKLDEGFKKGEIAKRLGKPANHITELLALIDAPDCVASIYSSGRCTSPKTIYELRALAEKFPEQVQEWCESGEDVTRRTVAELGDMLKGKKKTAAPLPSPAESGEQGTGEGGESDADKFRHDEIETNGTGEGGEPETTTLPYHNPENEKDTKEPAIPDPTKIKKPLLLVEYDGREAMVLLNRKPSSPGLLWIRYEDGSGDDEVDGAKCKINLLSESVQ